MFVPDFVNFFLQVLSLIFKGGYSRIPVFDRDRSDIVGLILAKDLIFIDPEVFIFRNLKSTYALFLMYMYLCHGTG